MVDAPVGNGRVILYANNQIYRSQTLDEHGMVFNALLFHNDLPTAGAQPATHDMTHRYVVAALMLLVTGAARASEVARLT